MKKLLIVIVLIILVIVGILYFGAPDTVTKPESAIDQSADTTESIDADLSTIDVDGELDADFKSLDADINSL